MAAGEMLLVAYFMRKCYNKGIDNNPLCIVERLRAFSTITKSRWQEGCMTWRFK